MTEIVKFRPEEIDEAIEGLDGLRDIIAPLLRRINGDGMGEQDAQQFIRQLTLAKHALIAMGGFLEAEMKMVHAQSNDPLTEEQLREICGEKPRWIVREDGEGRWVLVPYHTSAGLQTDSVLRLELRRIAIEANHRCFGCGFEHNCSLHGCAIIREALKRLALEEANEPLTPEQLREMEENVPIWIGGKGLNRWDIFVGISTAGPACFLRAALPMADCGKTWAPYRRKPEPCPVEGEDDGESEGLHQG